MLLARFTPHKNTTSVWDASPLISLPFPVPFSEWVTSAEFYWSTLAKRPRPIPAYRSFRYQRERLERYLPFLFSLNVKVSSASSPRYLRIEPADFQPVEHNGRRRGPGDTPESERPTGRSTADDPDIPQCPPKSPTSRTPKSGRPPP